MAKATRANGPSYTEDELNDPQRAETPVRVRRPIIGKVDREQYKADNDPKEEVASSPGMNSSPTTDQKPTEENETTPSRRPRARTTGNRSKAPEKEADSDASSTDGGTRNSETKPSDEVADEFDDFD